jgi:hypothetical protein
MKSLYSAVLQRINGEQPSRLRAVAGAVVVSAATGVATYRLLRA